MTSKLFTDTTVISTQYGKLLCSVALLLVATLASPRGSLGQLTTNIYNRNFPKLLACKTRLILSQTYMENIQY